jgi:hypothetical protein
VEVCMPAVGALGLPLFRRHNTRALKDKSKYA